MRTRAAWLFALATLVAACSGPAAAPPTPTPTPYVAPTPTPFVGTGVITFGTGLDDSTLMVTGARSTFKATTKSIAYSAELKETAGATTLTLIIASVSASGTEHQAYRQDIDVTDPESVVVGEKYDLAALVGRRKGTYVMRFLRDATILAEGRFTLN